VTENIYYIFAKVLVVLVLSIFFSRVVSADFRQKIFPYVVGILMLNYTIFFVLHIPLVSYVLQGGLPILCSAFLLYINPQEGVRLNSCEKRYLLFLAYFLSMTLFDDYTFEIVMAKILGFLYFFGVGWTTARYAVQNNQVERLMKVLALFSIPFLIALYKGSYDYQDIGSGERLGGDELGMLNANVVGLMATAALIAPLVVTVLLKTTLVQKMVSVAALAIGGFILIASGSRNAFGAFACACLVAVVFCSRVMKLVAIMIALIVGFLMYSTARFETPEDVRVLDLSVESYKSSRFEMYENIFYGTTAMQRLVGARSYIDRDINSGRAWGNAHSMYVQIAYEAGIIGVLLFGFYCVGHVRCALHNKNWGKLALVFLAAALVSGLAESYPLRPFSMTGLVWGLSLGVLNIAPKRDGFRQSGRML